MATKKAAPYSKWGMLEAVGITEHILLSILANNGSDQTDDMLKYKEKVPEVPTYGFLIELYCFAQDISLVLKRKVNRLLKVLEDTLFPLCSVSRADRLERRIKGLLYSFESMSKEEQVLHLQKQWIPQPTGAKSRITQVTKEMEKHGLCDQEFEQMINNPCRFSWTLKKPASRKFYVDLHNLLRKKRIPLEEMGIIYRAIDADLCQRTTGNKDAYAHVSRISLSHSDTEEDCASSDHSVSDLVPEKNSDGEMNRYKKHNVRRREKRSQIKIKELQTSLHYYKRISERQEKEIHQLSSAIEEYRQLLCEANSRIRHLEKLIKYLEETNEFLELELTDLRQQTDALHESNEAQVSQLTEQIRELQLNSSVETFSSRSFNSNVRELYYSLLSMRIPPGRIKPLVQNVICRLMPSLKVENIRLPNRSCAAYMRSQEMPTISALHKAAELAKSEQWHLNSDGTTLQQAKKVAFLINGIVLGVKDVSDGSSQTALDALKAELQKVNEAASVEVGDISRIVSSTSDGASTQCKFNRLLEVETGKQGSIIENKCAMHLGVNLRHAQVKAMAETIVGDSEEGQEPENIPSSHLTADNESSTDQEAEKRKHYTIDQFVHEVCKAFGHLGTPEYCHGASSFRVFLASKVKQSCGEEKEYYTKADGVFLERQVGSRYYVTSCNAGRIFFLKRAMIAFLKEQKLIKSLNLLESTCLKKLSDPLLITKAHLEGLMFDRVYADLMTLVKSTILNKNALNMNVHYTELLDFLEKLIDTPSLILNRDRTVFPSEPKLYSNEKALNHRQNKKYIPVHEMLYQDTCDSSLSLMVREVSKAMSKKLKEYYKDHLPGGRYYDPDIDTQTILSKLHPHNDKTESVFGANDWLNRILPNMAQATRSAMIEFSYNRTLEWLKLQGEEQKRTLIALAQQRRHLYIEQSKRDAEQLAERKMLHRAKLITKGEEKAKKIAAAIEDLKTETIIATVEDLKERELAIMSLTLHEKVKEAELKALVKRQVQLRMKVYQQKGIRILLTDKGKPKCAQGLLKELSKVITKYPVQVEPNAVAEKSSHQMLRVLFERPSLLAGC